MKTRSHLTRILTIIATIGTLLSGSVNAEETLWNKIVHPTSPAGTTSGQPSHTRKGEIRHKHAVALHSRDSRVQNAKREMAARHHRNTSQGHDAFTNN